MIGNNPLSNSVENLGLILLLATPPYAVRNLEHETWTGITPVASSSEAWAAYSVDNSINLFIYSGKPGFNLADMREWSGSASFRDGQSALTPEDLAAGAKPNYDELLAQLGIEPTSSALQKKMKLANELASSASESLRNAATSSKGQRHSKSSEQLMPICLESLKDERNPFTGDIFSPMATSMEKLASVTRHPSKLTTGEGPLCDQRWWCLVCNAEAIVQAAAGKVRREDLLNGTFPWDTTTKSCITCFDEGIIRCTKHALAPNVKRRGTGNPPNKLVFRCFAVHPNSDKVCGGWLEIVTGFGGRICEACGFHYGVDGEQFMLIDVEMGKHAGAVKKI